MTRINLQKISKYFVANRPIFQDFSYAFEGGKGVYIIKGANGSGKSTLLEILVGLLQIDEGRITYNINDSEIDSSRIYKYIAYTAPSIELVRDFTVRDFFVWLARFRSLYLSPLDIIETFGLQQFQAQQLRQLSSGWYQRIKLIQAFMCQSKVLCLDEPCMNFDTQGYVLYYKLLNHFLYQRLLIIASNETQEMDIKHQSVLLIN